MRITIYFVAVLLLISGSVYADQKSEKIITKKDAAVISGQVFIVTKGAANIRLALVDVVAIPEKEISAYFKAKLRQMALAEREFKQASDAEKAAERRVSEAFEPFMEANRWQNSAQEEEWKQFNIVKEASKIEANKKYVEYIGLKHKFDSLNESNALDHFNYFFDLSLSRGRIGKTDVDGKFKLAVPAGKYALAAKSSRDVFGYTENYYWLVWTNASAQSHPLMLSNDNLYDTKCKDCVQMDKI